LLLYLIQATQAGWEWNSSHLWIAGSVFAGLFVWITVLSLIALAMSAWVKWKIAAGGLILGIFFAGAGFGAAINNVMRTKYGTLIDLAQVIYTVWEKLLRAPISDQSINAAEAGIALATASAICLWLLVKKVRAFEVVK
jgi:ABC-2 type transport system permease protein